MKVLVTGGAGYIGSVVVQQLVAHGHQVVVLDDLSTGHRDAAHPEAEFLQGDIAQARTFLDQSFDGVLHFAAKSLVAESVTYPERYWHGNVVASLALIDAVRQAGVERFVFSSTAAVYGNPVSDTMTEEHPTAPINTYGASKLTIDHMLAAESTAHGLAAVSLRYFNVAGAAYSETGQVLRERHDPETHLIPNLLKVATGERETASIFGTDYPTRDGTAVRDYIHVLDLADAHIRALNAARGGVHEVYNLGTGTGSTVLEVLSAVRQVTGHPTPASEQPRRSGDPALLVASHTKATNELGWSPQRDIDDMVRDAWKAVSAV